MKKERLERFFTSWFDILSDHLGNLVKSFVGQDLPWMAVRVAITLIGVKVGLVLAEVTPVHLGSWTIPSLIGIALVLHAIYSLTYVKLDNSQGPIDLLYGIGFLAWAIATTITLPLWWNLVMWFFSL